jgi:sarcosine oxidase delta subunit
MSFKKNIMAVIVALISSTSYAVSDIQIGGYSKVVESQNSEGETDSFKSYVQVRRNNHGQVVTYLDHSMGIGFAQGISGVLIRQTLNELTFRQVNEDDMNNWQTEVMMPEEDGCEFSLKFSPDGQKVSVKAGSCSVWLEFSAKKDKK